MDAKLTVEQFQDHLAPTLDTYEQAIYLYLLRHSRLIGLEEIVVGSKSARREMAFGIGERGKAMAEKTCYEKLRPSVRETRLATFGDGSIASAVSLRLWPKSEAS